MNILKSNLHSKLYHGIRAGLRSLTFCFCSCILQVIFFFLFSLFFLNPSFSSFFLSLCFVHGFSKSKHLYVSFDQTQNPGSVYYIHPSVHSTLKFVTMPFNGTEFADWKRSILLVLFPRINWPLLMVVCQNQKIIHQILKHGRDVIQW